MHVIYKGIDKVLIFEILYEYNLAMTFNSRTVLSLAHANENEPINF